MLPESPERFEHPWRLLSQKSRKDDRRFARRAAALRENLRRRRQQYLARAVAQKEGHAKNDT